MGLAVGEALGLADGLAEGELVGLSVTTVYVVTTTSGLIVMGSTPGTVSFALV